MSLWSRIVNVIRGDRVSREIDEELQSHIDEAIQQGRDPAEVRRSFGPLLLQKEKSRDIRMAVWLDSLRADFVFACRQIKKKKVTSAAAILSLALAVGACTSAFRLIDALLLRPLPIKQPEQLYALFRQGVSPEGQPRISDSYEYPIFRQMRYAVKDQAELIAVSYVNRSGLTFGLGQEMEKAYLQYVSGSMFASFGLRPALGRLFTENDDLTPGAHPYAVLSHDYWTRRFGRDPKVIGRAFRIENDLIEIVGVAEERFTGTEPGTMTDIFIPTMMHAGVTHPGWGWIRTLARVKAGVAVEPLSERLQVIFLTYQQERAKELLLRPKQWVDRFLSERVFLEPAAAGLSDMQKHYRISLAVLGLLVALVLLIACANVANLMTAQAAARAREMALRISIGAGRWRLVQMVLVESACLAFLAAAVGAVLAWWFAPLVVGMINPPDNPARLSLPADWRVLGFGVALSVIVTLLFGLAPALRASAVKPSSALRGGEVPHSQRRMMHALIALQVAFCFIVHFAAGLFITTFDRLGKQAIGFSTERLLTLDVVAQPAQPAVLWDQITEHLRTMSGVETVALSRFPLLSGNSLNGFVAINGTAHTEDRSFFLSISPGWLDAMKIPFIDGRDFRGADTFPGVAIVNEAFAKRYFHGENPIGKSFEKPEQDGQRNRSQIVGIVRNALYQSVREPITPTVYVPFHAVSEKGGIQVMSKGTFIVRTSSANSLALASILRQEVPRARPEFRVSNIHTQAELVRAQTVRERLLAMLGLFFAVVALLLAGIGLYGVLDYSVLQRRREIGIRMAIGAQAGGIARLVTVDVFAMVLVGAVAGIAVGMASVRYIESLFYQVKPTDFPVIALPALTIFAAALLAALPAVIHATRIDPVKILRMD